MQKKRRGAWPVRGKSVTLAQRKQNAMTNDQLEFCTFCIGCVADALGLPEEEAYARLRDSGILADYIVRGYDVLHTFDRIYITDDIVSLMIERNVVEQAEYVPNTTADHIILMIKYSRIIALIAERQGITIEEAMEAFYNSETFYVMRHSDLFTMSDCYLAEDVRAEMAGMQVL